MKHFNGLRLLQAREMMGISRSDLARALDIDESRIARMEGGNEYPSEHVFDAICFKLGFPPSWFFRGDPPDFPMGSLLFH